MDKIDNLINIVTELKKDNENIKKNIDFLKKKINMLFYKLSNKCFVSTDESHSDSDSDSNSDCGCGLPPQKENLEIIEYLKSINNE